MNHEPDLELELKRALERLDQSFRGLADTRDRVGDTLNLALSELTRQINAIDQTLNPHAGPAIAAGATEYTAWPKAA